MAVGDEGPVRARRDVHEVLCHLDGTTVIDTPWKWNKDMNCSILAKGVAKHIVLPNESARLYSVKIAIVFVVVVGYFEPRQYL